MRTHNQIVIAHHVILMGYGHWLPNDPRGSGSKEVRQETLDDLGEVHHGRKREQPSREKLRQFYHEAEQRLAHELFWFDAAKRQALGDACEKLTRLRPYTVWACVIMTNQIHLCVRRHRNSGEQIWDDFAKSTREALIETSAVPHDHRVWSNRPYAVFLYTPEGVRSRIAYIDENPAKSNLPAQSWSFVLAYDGWPCR